MTKENKKQLSLMAALIAVIALSAWWITRNLLGPGINVKLHEGIGQVLADETVKLLKGKGNIVLITLPPKKSPVLDIQADAFRKAIKSRGGISVIETVALNTALQKAGPGL